MIMGVKVLPHRRAYWMKKEPFFYCHQIASIMSRKKFEAIERCLHIKDDSRAPTDPSHPAYDKLVKVRWLVEEVRDRCVANWKLGKFVTIDELMVRYKGTYGHGMKQYMPKKPIMFGFKIWVAADFESKYLHNFQVYTSADVKKNWHGAKVDEAKIGYEVVMHLMRDFHGLGHVVVIDNFFTSPRLLVDLFEKGTSMIWHNWIGLPSALTNVKKWGERSKAPLDGGCIAKGTFVAWYG